MYLYRIMSKFQHFLDIAGKELIVALLQPHDRQLEPRNREA